MRSVCKIIAITALMLHSTFGCSLHHAGACCTHSADTVAHHDHDSCCDHDAAVEPHSDDKGCGHDCTSDTSVFLTEPLSPCNQDVPCEEHGGSCHSEVGCSFLPSSPCSFSLDLAPVAFDSLASGLALRLNALAPRALAGSVIASTSSSLSSCALLCIWKI